MPKCSIIIPVYNHASLTRQCLNTILGNPPLGGDYEIIVVDDASTDTTPSLLKLYGSQIRVHTQSQNLGFATACNDGAALSTGEHLVFLNNDTLPVPGWLDVLVQYAESHPGAAVVGSKLLFPNNTVQHAGVVICQDLHPRHLYSGFPADHPAVNKSRRFQIVTAACALFRREAFEQVGGFDTAFKNSYEDVDICLRLGEKGYEIHYCHQSVLCHLESVSRDTRGAQEMHNFQIYFSRWAHRLKPDDLAYYLGDEMLRVAYRELYPLQIEISPLLAVVAGGDSERQADRLLDARARQVFDLLKENIYLKTRAESAPRGEDYRQLVDRIRQVVQNTLPSEATVLVVSKGDNELLEWGGRKCWHFPQTENGAYAGYYPGSSTAAIAHMEALRAKGADYILFPATCFWWLNYYAGFREHLERRYEKIEGGEGVCAIYALRRRTGGVADRWQEQFEQVLAECRRQLDHDAAILDWNTGLQLADAFPHEKVFSPLSIGQMLPYLDHSVDIVAVASPGRALLDEARRVSRTAVVTFKPEKGVRGSRTHGLSVDWLRARTEVYAPASSIIIPTFNGAANLNMCLDALEETLPPDFRGEIIVVNDASTDETEGLVEDRKKREKRLRLIRNNRNLGFLTSCNVGSKEANGEILIFLNNDTLPEPGWLPPILQLFGEYPDAGAVGGRLLYPDGRLQEAGGVVFCDGSAANFGRGDLNVDDPLFTYVREVDYCSGALLATPRELFKKLGGFDERYRPAYYEDTDYCFQVRTQGLKVYYQPESIIIHSEGATSGTDLKSGTKRYQVLNRSKFVRKWRRALKRQPAPPNRIDIETWHALAVRENSPRQMP